MKIAIVTESFYPCGVLTVVEDIYDNLKKKSNFDPVYIGPSTPFNKTKDGIWLPSKLTSKTRSYYRTLFFLPLQPGTNFEMPLIMWSLFIFTLYQYLP